MRSLRPRTWREKANHAPSGDQAGLVVNEVVVGEVGEIITSGVRDVDFHAGTGRIGLGGDGVETGERDEECQE